MNHMDRSDYSYHGHGHDERFHCSFGDCSLVFKRRDRLEIHLRTHTGERPFVCLFPGCSKTYARSQHLSRHISRVHNSKSPNLFKVCLQCNRQLADSNSLKLHESRFHNVIENKSKFYECQEEGCDQIFRKRQQLVVHKQNAHAIHLDKAVCMHKCPYEECDKSFVFPNKLKRHLRVHQGYPCDAEGCEDVLPTWTKLRLHKAEKHHPGLECKICDKSFKSRDNFRQHQIIHQEKTSFLCPRDGCSRTFLYKKNLVQHIRAFHDGEKVFTKKKNPDTKPRKRPRPSKKKASNTKEMIAAKLSGLENPPTNFESLQISTITPDGTQEALSSSPGTLIALLSDNLTSPTSNTIIVSSSDMLNASSDTVTTSS